MDEAVTLLKRIYDRFNARDIAGVLADLDDDVVWANGMDGGHEHGHDAVRAYWSRQWSIVSPHVEPVSFREVGDGSIAVEVRQFVRELDGRPLQDPAHGLSDRTVLHVFHVGHGKVKRFDIRDIAPTTGP